MPLKRLSLSIRVSVSLILGVFCNIGGRSTLAAEGYVYDDLGRLTQVRCGDGTAISFTYDPAGNRLSQTIFLSAPTITNNPAGQTIVADDTAIFSVGANGSAPLNYQWRYN